VLITVYRDRSFTFYYQDNLDAFSANGAEITYIDSMNDKRLPDIDALYVGGNFMTDNWKTKIKWKIKYQMGFKKPINEWGFFGPFDIMGVWYKYKRNSNIFAKLYTRVEVRGGSSLDEFLSMMQHNRWALRLEINGEPVISWGFIRESTKSGAIGLPKWYVTSFEIEEYGEEEYKAVLKRIENDKY